MPGAAWGVIVDGELAHIGRRRAARRRRRSRRSTPTRVFRIASMTKSFTAISILKLRDEGKLSLDDPAERYVPEMAGMKYPTSDAPKITIRHLLSHAEGFPEDNPWGDRQLADTDEQLSQMLRGGIPFSNAPGHRLRVLQSRLRHPRPHRLQRVEDAVRRLRDREHPAAARHDVDDARAVDGRGRTGSSHGYRWEDEQWKDEPLLANGSFGSMGGMLTSVRDLSRYVAMFLSACEITAPTYRASPE